jgi:hypothetical protein
MTGDASNDVSYPQIRARLARTGVLSSQAPCNLTREGLYSHRVRSLILKEVKVSNCLCPGTRDGILSATHVVKSVLAATVVFAFVFLVRLPCGKGLATHRRVDGIEGAQAMEICHAAHGDRIAQILNLALRVGKCVPRGKVWAVRIA